MNAKNYGLNSSILLQDIEEVYQSNSEWEKFRDTTVLITGPNGMLASYLMYMFIFLNENKHMNIHIIAMARSQKRFEARFMECGNKDYIQVVTDSILEPIKIESKVDYIFHAASLASPQYYSVSPVDVLSPNVIGTYNLLKFAAEKKVKDFLLFSTGDVYGVIKNCDYITENNYGVLNPLDIHSCYSESKRMAENMCFSFMHQYGVPIKIYRIWHTYAPTMDINNDPRVFSSFIKNVVNSQNIEMKSDGLGKRSFCYISDAISGMFAVLFKGENGEAYNICNTDQFVTIRELAEILVTLRKDVELKVTWKERPKDEHYTENTAIGDVAPSNQKLKLLGWTPKHDIRDGFERVLQYFMEH